MWCRTDDKSMHCQLWKNDSFRWLFWGSAMLLVAALITGLVVACVYATQPAPLTAPTKAAEKTVDPWDRVDVSI